MEAMMKKSLFAAAIAAAAALPLGGCASVAHLAGVNEKMIAKCNNPDFVLAPAGCYFDTPRDCQQANATHIADCQKAATWNGGETYERGIASGVAYERYAAAAVNPMQAYAMQLLTDSPSSEAQAIASLLNSSLNAGVRAALGDYFHIAYPPMRVQQSDLQNYRDTQKGYLPAGSNPAGVHWENTFNGDLPLEINQQ